MRLVRLQYHGPSIPVGPTLPPLCSAEGSTEQDGGIFHTDALLDHLISNFNMASGQILADVYMSGQYQSIGYCTSFLLFSFLFLIFFKFFVLNLY